MTSVNHDTCSCSVSLDCENMVHDVTKSDSFAAEVNARAETQNERVLRVGSRESVVDGLVVEYGNQRGRFRLCLVLFASAVNAWQFLDDELGGHTRLTADPTQPSVYCGFQARVGGLSAVATPSSGFSVFFPAKVVDKRNL